MTIASQTSRITYTGDGSTTAFAVPFYFAANADLVVYLQDTLGNQTTQVLGTNYNLTGATLSAGGTCTFTTAPTTGYLVTIYRDPAITQTTSYNNNDPFPAKSHETALDKLTTIAQRAKDQVSRAIHQTEGEAAMTTALASVATRKNKILAFDSNGALSYVLGPTFVGNSATGVAIVDSRATAAVTTFAVSVNVLITNGLAAAGDGGGRSYLRGTISSIGAFADASGQYWALFATTSGSGLPTPGGRLTLTSGIPVMGTSVSAQTTVYYTPYAGNLVPIYDGTNMIPTAFSEISQATTDATKSPAAVTTSSLYDVFVWNDSGTIRATRGPAWTNSTTRSAGTALVLVNGIYLNNATITNGPAASRGTYVGTIASNGTSTIDYIFGTVGAGGVAANFGVWNTYNRVSVGTMVRDNTDSWTYAVNAVWRAANGSSTFRVTAVRGLDEDTIEAAYNAIGKAGASATAIAGVGLDTTTSFSGTNGFTLATTYGSFTSRYTGLMGLGQHYVSGNEYNDTTTASTWRGLISTVPAPSGLHVTLRQ